MIVTHMVTMAKCYICFEENSVSDGVFTCWQCGNTNHVAYPPGGKTNAKSIRDMVEQLKRLKNAIEDEVVAEVPIVAKRLNIDEVYWGPCSNEYKRDGRYVNCSELEALDNVICSYVRPGGLILMWKKGEGFV